MIIYIIVGIILGFLIVASLFAFLNISSEQEKRNDDEINKLKEDK